MGETRVNLKHLLEDIRDTYPFPQEEAIIVELIANALDSGASQIRFVIDPDHRTASILDDGKGMTDRDLEEYHDIAATTKTRGKGIGFAGVGVKLSLLIAEEVITETRSRGFHKGTCWKLESAQRAPWTYIDPPGLVFSSNGTVVSIVLQSNDSELLNPDFAKRVIQTHFYPILDHEFMDKILKYIYKNGVTFFVNEQEIDLPVVEKTDQSTLFLVEVGRRGKPVGIGFLRKSKEELREEERGIAISTYGKVIKRGWDWISMIPRNPTRLTGIVEIPSLSEILTTNKADFLKDSTSLQKYYRYRKAIQEAVEPVLRQFGEMITPREPIEKELRPLEKEIERVLKNMLDDFPELGPLLGKRGIKGGRAPGPGEPSEPTEPPEEPPEPPPEPTEPQIEPPPEGHPPEPKPPGHRKPPGLMIGFEDNPDREDLGWSMESTIWINKGHPAYIRAIESKAENYHIVLSVAWVLSGHLEAEKSPQKFINRFLSSWGARI